MNKTIKRIIALGTGAAMLGATVLGAMAAADLNAYPKPFVVDGKFNGYLVIGEKAQTIDTIGATDIGMSLQAANVVTTTVGGTTETIVEGGQKIETSSSKLYLGTDLYDAKASFTDSDFPVLLKQETITGDDGTDYSYDLVIKNPATFPVTFDTTTESDSPVLHLDTSTGSITLEANFDRQIDLSETGIAGKELVLFGKSYTISDAAGEVSATKLTLYSTALDQTFAAGEAETTVTVGGKEVKVTVIGVSTGTTGAATIKVNGETKSVVSGHSYTIGGNKLYVKDVMAYDQPIGGGAVRLFLGSDKIELNSDGEIKKITSAGSTSLEGVEVSGTPDFTALTSLKILVTPSGFDESVDAVTDELIDPLFGTFKYKLVGPTPAFDDTTGRELIKFQPDSSTKMKMTFTTRDSKTITWSPIVWTGSAYEYKIGTTNPIVFDCNNDTGTDVLSDENYFILNVGDQYTHILQLKKIETGDTKYIDVKDLGTGETTTFSYDGTTRLGNFRYNGEEIEFKVDETAGSENIALTVANCDDVVYTKKGAAIDFGAPGASVDFVLDEQGAAWKADSTARAPGTITVNVTHNPTDDVFIDQNTPTIALADSKSEVGVNAFGTYAKYNSDTYITELYYAEDPTTYGVFVAPTGAGTTTTGGSQTTDKVNKIAVGATVFDTEIMAGDYHSSNLIVVGGPCANTVAAALYQTGTVCAEGFEQGKAIIKLYEHTNGKIAILVAGYEGVDTLRAARVLAAYDKYALTGKEMSVIQKNANEVEVTAIA